MGLDFEELKRVFLVRQINIRGNVTEIPLKFQEAKGKKKHAFKKQDRFMLNSVNTAGQSQLVGRIAWLQKKINKI